MSDPIRRDSPAPPPPPAPPLPPQKIANRAASALARFAPAFIAATRGGNAPVPRQVDPVGSRQLMLRTSLQISSKTLTHRTGLSIAAVDISPDGNHAIVAGREILRTLRVDGDTCAEEFNLRSAIINYASTHNAVAGTLPSRIKDNLAATDVKWSHGDYDKTIATAAANGRVVVYDLHKAGVELAKMHEHSRQVHRLAFNPVRPAVLLSASSDATVRLWDLRILANDRVVMSCRSQQRFPGYSEAIRDVRWRPLEGYEFATASDAGVIQRWDIRKDSAPLLKINAHEKPCHSIDWHPDGKHVLSAGFDGYVKIYDFSTQERRQRPLRQIKAPQAVLNARWRPPCRSSEDEEPRDWQSTQLVTSYDNTDPRIHLWDLQRPKLPFREFDRFDRGCTDILWHSQNLLWTVGNDGMFVQTDIHFAPQSIRRRNLCSFDWNTASGKLRMGSHRRRQRRGSGLGDTSEFLISNTKERGSSGEKIGASNSFTDDGMDETFLSTSFRKRHGKLSSSRSSKSLGGTPPSADDSTPAIHLEISLEKSAQFEPLRNQLLALVVWGVCPDPLVQKLYAWSNQRLLDYNLKGPRIDLLEDMERVFEDSAQRAELALMYRLAQSWRIAGLVVVEELDARAQFRVAKRLDEARARKEKANRETAATAGHQTPLLESRTEKMKTHLFKGVVEREGRLGHGEMDSTSNMTTPLARPLPDSPLSTAPQFQQSPLPNSYHNDEELGPLPPSILSEEPMTMEIGVLDETQDDTSLFRSLIDYVEEHDRSGSIKSSLTPPLPPSLESLPISRAQEDRSAPRAIEGRAGWRKEKSSQASASPSMPSFDRVAEARRAALNEYRPAQRALVNFDSAGDGGQNRLLRAPLDRHESAESFPMFSASTDSSHRLRSLGGSLSASHHSNNSDPLLDAWDIDELPVSHHHSQPLFKSDSLPASDVVPLSLSSEVDSDPLLYQPPLSQKASRQLSEDGLPILRFRHPLLPLVQPQGKGACKEHLEAPQGLDGPDPGDFLPEPLGTTSAPGDFQGPLSRAESTAGTGSSLARPTIPAETAAAGAGSPPWDSSRVIEQIISFHTQSQSTIQLPAQLLSLIQPYLNASHSIVSSLQSQQIFSSYNDVLLRQGLVIEAAELRKICAYSYPSIYAYAQEQQDTYINVFCHTCHTPFQNRKRNNFLCETCGSKQAPCPVCLSVKPPTEWSIKGEAATSMKGAGLWAWCQGCGHGGHVACMERWLSNAEVSEGGCASQGCLHDCAPGRRRQEKTRLREEREREKHKGRAKRDSWTVPESKAVERTRSVLVSQGNQGGSPGTTTPTASHAGAVKEAKKVRLVIPNEEQGAAGVMTSGSGSGTGTGIIGSGGVSSGGSGSSTLSSVGLGHYGGRRDVVGRRSGLLRWGSDGAADGTTRGGGDGDVDSPISRVSGMAASME